MFKEMFAKKVLRLIEEIYHRTINKRSYINNRIETLLHRIVTREVSLTTKTWEEFKEDIVHCEVCGCLIYEPNAIKGKSVIATKTNTTRFVIPTTEEYVRKVYYCRVHRPTESHPFLEGENK